MAEKSTINQLIKQLFEFQVRQTAEIAKLVERINNIGRNVETALTAINSSDTKICIEQLKSSISSLEDAVDSCSKSNDVSRIMLEQLTVAIALLSKDNKNITEAQEKINDCLNEIRKTEKQSIAVKNKRFEKLFQTSVPLRIVLIIVAILVAIILIALGLKEHVFTFLKLIF